MSDGLAVAMDGASYTKYVGTADYVGTATTALYPEYYRLIFEKQLYTIDSWNGLIHRTCAIFGCLMWEGHKYILWTSVKVVLGSGSGHEPSKPSAPSHCGDPRPSCMAGGCTIPTDGFIAYQLSGRPGLA
ncbi:hypothetical protein J6590_050661 [Homalodisca vitripennis]|nr:hypothetical protein J6590_050661 [Homalodisca vitripennis]